MMTSEECTRFKPEDLLLQKENLSSFFNWSELFNNSNPVELEIGTGKGRFMRAMAEIYPERNFFGIERARKFGKIALERAARDGLANFRMFYGDGPELLEEHVKDESLKTIYILYTDPWPKKRHHKRRLVNPDNLKLFERKIIKGGQLIIKTDFGSMFEEMEQLVRDECNLKILESGAVSPERFDERLKTNYEIKTVARGEKVFYLESVKE